MTADDFKAGSAVAANLRALRLYHCERELMRTVEVVGRLCGLAYMCCNCLIPVIFFAMLLFAG